ncbi:MAG: CinA family nicotinamide mononucleotide deamidase-related protein [Fibrobacteria bacterium]|nr:CinA family nicotinamide mononucleotide deamidase-related protein [Fibrobacteria bacterium]
MDRLSVIVVGDEILQGRRQEANAAWIARQAAEAGLDLCEVRIVSDSPGSLAEALAALRRQGGEVVVTGGLGPTRDDRTRQELADHFGSPLALREEALQAVEASYRRRSIDMDPAARVQAMMPEVATMVPNDFGTAPGMRVETEGFAVTCLPGVPREMKGMWTEQLLPLLARNRTAPGIARCFTHGLGESVQESRMASLGLEDVEFCSLPGPWGVELQCRVSTGDPSTRQARAEAARELVARALGGSVVRPLGATLLEALVQGLRERRWSVALAESCTAGWATVQLAGLPGVSDVLRGGVVAYDNEVKVRLLGVSEDNLARNGAVSESTALEMARGVRERMAPEGLGLAVTGVAGPGGGTPEKPVGTVWIAASAPGVEVAELLHLVGDRTLVRERAAWRLLGLAWSLVAGSDGKS